MACFILSLIELSVSKLQLTDAIRTSAEKSDIRNKSVPHRPNALVHECLKAALSVSALKSSTLTSVCQTGSHSGHQYRAQMALFLTQRLM